MVAYPESLDRDFGTGVGSAEDVGKSSRGGRIPRMANLDAFDEKGLGQLVAVRGELNQ